MTVSSQRGEIKVDGIMCSEGRFIKQRRGFTGLWRLFDRDHRALGDGSRERNGSGTEAARD